MMGSICAEQQQHKFHHSHHLYGGALTKKTLREIDIPPRKLLSRRPSAAADSFTDSPKAEDAVFSKFLPYNSLNDDDDDSDPYSSDHFRMYEFKVRKCNRSRSHDWTDCPFAHPGEKARRRDPRRFHYSGTVCAEFRKGHCSKGDNCEFSHGVFECWLHPSRYRTEACKDGKNCKRKVCFFAHTTRQLRILSESPPPGEKQYRNMNQCCVFCHSMAANSPTSTLMGMSSHVSPPVSPPISPAAYGGSCGFPAEFASAGGMSYKDKLTELMATFEAMNVSEASSPSHLAANNGNLTWLDVNFNVEEQPQFVMSPSTPSQAPSPLSLGHSKMFAGDSKFLHGDYSGRNLMEDMSRYNTHETNSGGPDLGWVNDLLT